MAAKRKSSFGKKKKPRLKVRARPSRSKLERAALRFHEANPQVYVLFKKYAFQAARARHRHFGVAMIWERLRWHTMVETQGDAYKLNNNHRAYYARMFMADYPEHREFFRTRRVKHEARDE